VNALYPKTVLLAKHAQHVVLIHFPIALFITAVFFDLIAPASRCQLTPTFVICYVDQL
jgi:uncharacterized membrane protein